MMVFKHLLVFTALFRLCSADDEDINPGMLEEDRRAAYHERGYVWPPTP
jgi:hypothetical protein